MRTLSVVGWLHIKDKKILAVKSRDNTVWYVPGGKVEKGESDPVALCREIYEELGITLVPNTIQYFATIVTEAHGHTQDTQVEMRIYKAKYSGEIVTSGEITSYGYIGMKDFVDAAKADQELLRLTHAQGLVD